MNVRAGCLLVAGLLSACRRGNAERAVSPTSNEPTPAADEGDDCLDLGGVRACYRGKETLLVARTLPSTPAPTALGLRCLGSFATRRCADRALLAPPFECKDGTCVQLHPRMPDAGPWTCTASAGAVVCVGPEASAVVNGSGQKTVSDRGFRCGTRATKAADRRVCVDLDPDFPEGTAHQQRCWYEHVPERRVCMRDATAAVLGDPCDTTHPCVDGAACIGARCLPTRPEPACALDEDCGLGRCRFGSCVGP